MFVYNILFIVILTIFSFIIWSRLFIFFSPNQIEISKKLILSKKREEIEKESPVLIPYSIAIYKWPLIYNNENVMVHIMPQNYHFFVEQGKLIYHPIYNNINNNNNNNTCCDILSDFPEMAYILSVEESTNSLIIPHKTKMCRRPLEDLKRNIYTLMTYRLQTHHLKNPLTLLHHLSLIGRIKIKK
ncbi:hypothetical protein TCON_2117 [Astathelohania contejeani]|uniref:Uncharacterized protein n=1 Tax=Astathelohania contejeani TaxID=164912 RepID=A0ABQ7HWZ6_9MICR|nr:hypothetical protein TCON_2117 [Thelohania contejeani]